MTNLKIAEKRQKTHISANTEVKKDTKSKKGLSYCDVFQPCSMVSSGGRTSREMN